jgi:hypothetical protein
LRRHAACWLAAWLQTSCSQRAGSACAGKVQGLGRLP